MAYRTPGRVESEDTKKHLPPTPETVESLLDEGGWAFHRITPDTWRSRFRGRKDTFPFLIRLDPGGYLTFAIVPFLKSPLDADKGAALYARLLELNQVLLMAKFSIDDDLDVVLSVEYPSEQLDKSEFTDALNVLSYYADNHYDELLQIAAET